MLALTAKAQIPGAVGNAIALAFDDVAVNAATPGSTTTDLALAYEDRRPGLTIATVGAQSGAPAGAQVPGLVTLEAPAAKLPAVLAPTIDDQLRICREQAARDGWKVVAVYKDAPISGASVTLRPGIQSLLQDAQAGKFDVIVSDSLGSSVARPG